MTRATQLFSLLGGGAAIWLVLILQLIDTSKFISHKQMEIVQVVRHSKAQESERMVAEPSHR